MVESDSRGVARNHRQPFSWSSATYTLEQLISQFSLPQVVRLEPRRGDVQTLGNFDLRQPLYLYSERNVRKVCARNLRAGETVLGESLIIPEDYAGWFIVLCTSNSRQHYYETIHDLAMSNATEFLITDRLGGYQVVRAQDGEYSYDRRDFLPGDVLRIGKTYVGKRKVRDESSIFRRKKEIDVYYLKCMDDKDREILFSFDAKGKFYVVSYPNGKTSRCTMQIADILKMNSLPISVQLVYGRLPTAPCSFTGYLTLTSSFLEHTIIASTILDTKNIFLELAHESPILVSLARQTPDFNRNVLVTQAMRFCIEQAQQYTTGIKASFENNAIPAQRPLPPISPNRMAVAMNRVAPSAGDSYSDNAYSTPHTGQQASEAVEYLSVVSDHLNGGTDDANSAVYVNAFRGNSSSERSSPDNLSSDCISLSEFPDIQPAPDIVTTLQFPTANEVCRDTSKTKPNHSSENVTSSDNISKLNREKSEDDYEFLWFQGAASQEGQQIQATRLGNQPLSNMTIPGCRISVEGSYLLYPIFLDKDFSKHHSNEKVTNSSTDVAVLTLAPSDESVNQNEYMPASHTSRIQLSDDVTYTPLQLDSCQVVDRLVPPHQYCNLEESTPPPIPPRMPTR